MLNDLDYEDFEPKNFSAARRAFEAKTVLPARAFARLEATARNSAFRISGVEAMRDIMAARSVIARAIDGELTMGDALFALQEQLAPGDFSRRTLAHLQMAIQQNVAMAQAAARREALTHPDVVGQFPYWQYLTARDQAVRPTHAALHGLVFRYDDPFWESHLPPWEPRCRCYFIPLRRQDVERMGVEIRDIEFVRDRLGIEPNPEWGAPPSLADLGLLIQGKRLLEGLDEDLREKLEEQARSGPRSERDRTEGT